MYFIINDNKNESIKPFKSKARIPGFEVTENEEKLRFQRVIAESILKLQKRFDLMNTRL